MWQWAHKGPLAVKLISFEFSHISQEELKQCRVFVNSLSRGTNIDSFNTKHVLYEAFYFLDKPTVYRLEQYPYTKPASYLPNIPF